MSWLSAIFPYRTHLEAEICWLQDQLAQKQRRCDELQEALVQIKQPSMKIQYERKPDGELKPVQPRGWESYRAFRRDHPNPELDQRQQDVLAAWLPKPEAPEPTEGPFKTEA